ncbi:MAG: S41 family peptidase [Chloroflexi bacterium]|nr:MAG: S41 family peptidase [Chloroflexota bacterium]
MTPLDPPTQPPAPGDPVPDSTVQPTPSQAPARTPTATWIVGLALAASIGAVLFAGGYLAAGGNRQAATCSAPSTAFAAFCEAYQKLKSNYVDKLDDTKLVEGAIQGMFQNGVQDPFSGYMSPQDYQQALGSLSGKFSGIGAEMAVKNLKEPANLSACATLSDNCVLVVVSPISGSPADRAGLQPGDVVTAVDGKSVIGSTIQDQISKVRGPSGTKVTLTIKRDARTLDLAITREEITTQEVESKMLDGHVGYIALHGFSESSSDQFHAALNGLLDKGATQIVFDLRGNPGGYIYSAQKIASEFVSSGTIFTQESTGGAVKPWPALGDGIATNPKLSVVVLINNGSASASEIVSAALKELHRATLIGEHTFGKNTVQIWAPLQNGAGGGVRITISRWFPPNHDSVHPNGVQPDVAVTIPAGTPPEKDLVLDRALAFLAKQTGSPASPVPSGSPTAFVPDAALISWDNGGLRSAFV